jgi:hypothetical protein
MPTFYRDPLVDHDAFAAYGGATLMGYCGGLGDATPLPQIPTQQKAQETLEALRKKYGLDSAKKQAEAYVKAQASAILQKSGAAAAKKYLEEQGRAYIEQASQTLGVDAARAYAKDFLKTMPNVPDLPIQLPSKLTVSEIEKAAYGTGKKYAEGLIRSKIGVSVELPRKLTVKEISRSVDSLIPDNAREAMETALTVGSQLAAGAASSALTGVLAATAIGSAVPGLGTLVGLGVGLATVALRGVIVKTFTKSACELDKSRCKCKTPAGFKCPEPGKRSPVEMLPWLAQEQAKLDKIVLSPPLCDVGKVPECKRYLATISTLIIPYVGTSIPVMGLPALEKLLPQYEAAAKLARTGQGFTHQGDAGGLIKYGWAASTNSLGFVTPGVAPPLATMQQRISKLRSLAARINGMGKGGDLSSMRWDLVTEMTNAAQQYALNPSGENQQWFVFLGTALGKLGAAEVTQRQQTAATQQAGKDLYAQRLASPAGPLWKLYGEMDNAVFAGKPVDALFAQVVELHRKGLRLPPQPKGSSYAVWEEKAEAAIGGKTAAAPAKSTMVGKPKPTKVGAEPPAPKPVKRQEQNLDKLRKEVEKLRSMAKEARDRRVLAQRAIRTKDVQRQQAAAAGLTPVQQAQALQPAQAQTAAALTQATAAAADAANQQAAVQRAAARAGVPVSAVQAILARQALAASQRPAAPFFQRTFTAQPFSPQAGAEPATPALPTDRPDLFLPFYRQ